MTASHEPLSFINSDFFFIPRNATKSEKKAHHREKGQLRRMATLQMRHHQPMSRRAFINYVTFSSLILGNCSASKTATALSFPFTAPEDLTQRLKARITKEPTLRLYEHDIFYPEYFAGTWETQSTLLAVECPAGYKLFGRPGSFEAAQEEVNRPLLYQSRFVRSGSAVISDRTFNVTSIARASMGDSSVLDCTQVGSTPNRVTMTLRPNSAGGVVYNVDLHIIARQQQMDSVPNNLESQFRMQQREIGDSEEEGVTGSEFGLYTSETMRQEVRLNTDDLRVMPLIKDVETTTVFVIDPRDEGCIRGWQKTSVYLTKSDLRYPDARGRPVDVRWYRLKYLR